MSDLVKYIAKSLVDNPDAVQVTEIRTSRAIILKLSVDPDDKGWVIGRKGRVANATRTLVRVAAATQGKQRTILEIV
jgi:predicted RNA-binding protein YlqC (UPF0109 family)